MTVLPRLLRLPLRCRPSSFKGSRARTLRGTRPCCSAMTYDRTVDHGGAGSARVGQICRPAWILIGFHGVLLARPDRHSSCSISPARDCSATVDTPVVFHFTGVRRRLSRASGARAQPTTARKPARRLLLGAMNFGLAGLSLADRRNVRHTSAVAWAQVMADQRQAVAIRPSLVGHRASPHGAGAHR